MSEAELLDYSLRFLLGGIIVLTATYLSQVDKPVLAGAAILFPGITLTSYFIIGYTQDLSAVRAAIPASLYAAAGYFILLPVMYLTSKYIGLLGALTVSLISWLIAVYLLVKVLPTEFV